MTASPIVRARDAFDLALREFVDASVVAECWRLHQAAPSAAGWRQLASYGPAAAHTSPLSRDAFGDLLDVAIRTLTTAIDDEPEGGRRVVMTSWLGRLAG